MMLNGVETSSAPFQRVKFLNGDRMTVKDFWLDLGPHNTLFARGLENVYSTRECQALIQRSEKEGYIPAVINTGVGSQGIMDKSHRDSDRVIIDDYAFAVDLFERIQPWLPAEMHGHSIAGVNERLRFLRYGVGQKFRPHCDGCFERPDGSQKSMLTLQVYLNGGKDDGEDQLRGGETTFFDDMGQRKYSLRPATGQVVIFDHDHLHESSPVVTGQKHVIRSDVMYKLPHRVIKND